MSVAASRGSRSSFMGEPRFLEMEREGVADKKEKIGREKDLTFLNGCIIRLMLCFRCAISSTLFRQVRLCP